MFFSLKEKKEEIKTEPESEKKIAKVAPILYGNVENPIMSKYIGQITTEGVSVGDTVEGKVSAISRTEVYVELAPYGTGIIYGSEYLSSRDILKNINAGDEVTAKVILERNEDGYIELSLREARTAIIWNEILQAQKDGTVYSVTPKEANKGGLIIKFKGVNGFLPASQLSEANYPRVLGGNKDAILSELKHLLNKSIDVCIINADPKDDTLIFSEKRDSANAGENVQGIDASTPEYKEGDIVEGTVTGIVDFGIFVKLGKGIEGLVHISEISHGLVSDPNKLYSVGDKISVKVINIKDRKYSLSIKALLKSPWESISTKYKKGDAIEAVVLKHSEYGLLAAIEEGITGLAHISIFKNVGGDWTEKYQLGTSHKFVLTEFNPTEQKISLIPEELYMESRGRGRDQESEPSSEEE